MLIGLCGYKNHGKDTVAKTIIRHFGYVKLAFADPLKAVALASDPYVKLNNGEFRKLSTLVNQYGWDDAKKHDDVRRFIQRLGTEGIRQVINEDLWIDMAFKKYIELNAAGKSVVVTDVRFFPNESNLITTEGGKIIKVFDPRKDYKDIHSSESMVDLIKEDYFILNDGSKQDLESKVLAVMEKIG